MFFKNIHINKIQLILCVLIFVLAFISRYTAYIDYSTATYSHPHFIEGLGSGSDSDSQIKNSLFLINRDGVNETFTHYDYVFLIPTLAFFMHFFGFANGLQVSMLYTITLGSLAAVIPFVLLNKLNKRSLGAVFAGFMLALNPLLAEVAGGRFVLDTTVYFIFALFVCCYVLAIETRKIKWIVLTGVVALVQGLNKPLLMVNDFPFLAIFALIFAVKKIAFKRVPPYLTFSFHPIKKNLLVGFIPLAIYAIGNLAFELFVLATYRRPYFIGDILFSRGSGSSVQFALNDSLYQMRAPADMVLYIFKLTQTAILALAENVSLALSPAILIGLLLASFVWSKKHFILGISQIFYLAAVSLSYNAGIAPRHFVTLVIWAIISIALLVDVAGEFIFKRFRPRVYYFFLILLLLVLVKPVSATLMKFHQMRLYTQRETLYYRWVSTIVPENAYILGGTGQDLAALSHYTKRTILYNTFSGNPMMVPVNSTAQNVKDFGRPAQRPMEYGAFLLQHSTKKHDLYVLDTNMSGWRTLMSSGAIGQMPANKYTVKEVARNKTLNRSLYLLILNTE